MKKITKYLNAKIDCGKFPNIDKIIKKTSRFEYVSFDIFDTLLKRNIPHFHDLFDIMEAQLKSKYPNFKKERLLAENRARLATSDCEITLNDIYEYYSDISESEALLLIEKELYIEEMVLCVNYDIIVFYNQCIEAGKTVLLVSDMYLPKAFIEKILKKNGICIYSKLYLSGDKKKTKSKGTLFQLLFKEQGIHPEELIHIGDSWKADYLVPRMIGAKSIHVPRITKRGEYKTNTKNRDIGEMYLNSFINNTLPVKSDPYYRFGYEKLGMLLWGYAKWNLHIAKQKNCNSLYFFSRDGMMMKKAVDICNSDPDIKTYYLEVSRKSLRTPLLWIDCTLDVVLDMLQPHSEMPMTSFMDGVGLEISSYKKILDKYGFDENQTFNRKSAMQNEPLVQLFEEIKPDIIKNSKVEYELLKRYIAQFKIKDTFAIIDIGWAGSLQRYLIQMLNDLEIKCHVEGLYVGVSPTYKRHLEAIKDFNVNGYLFDASHNPDDKDIREFFWALLEIMFVENDGSVKNYEIDEKTGIVSGVRYPYEYKIDGQYTEEYDRIRRVQLGALNFVENAASDELLNQFDYSANTLFSRIYQAGNAPKQSDLKLFADFRFFEEGLVRRLAAPRSIFYYVLHWKKLRRDFFLSGWKVGFTKRLVGINLPFIKILNIMYKLFVK